MKQKKYLLLKLQKYHEGGIESIDEAKDIADNIFNKKN